MKPLAIVVTGEPVAEARAARGTFADMIRAAVGPLWPGPWLELDARAEELPVQPEVAGLVVTGSAASVTERAAWMLRTEAFLERAVTLGIPTFGICFGHQLLGQALGGEVRRNPRGREIGTVTLRVVEADPLLAAPGSALRANMTHVDSVVRLPAGARVLAHTPLEPHAAVRFGERTWGVQFHPEMDGRSIAAYVAARSEAIQAEGLDLDAIARTAGDAPEGARVLGRFVEHALLGL